MTKEEKYQHIEDFLDGKLNKEEEKAFSEKMAIDANFKKEVELHKSLSKSLNNPAKNNLRNVLNEVDKDWNDGTIQEATVKALPSSKANTKYWLRPLTGIAAGLVLLLIALQFFKSTSPKEDLFAANYTPYKMILSERSVDNDAAQLLKNSASEAYKKGDFESAQKLFKQLYTENPNDIVYSFYEANAFLSNQKPKEAIAAFQAILAKPDHLFVEQCQWYLGLAYLADQNFEKARETFGQINEGSFKFKEAKEILNSL